MDIIENIEIPSFEKKRDKFRRGVTLLTGTIAIAVLLERYNGCVTRGLKSMKRGAAAALMAWMEDRSGTRLFTLEGDEPPPLSSSMLHLSAQRVAAGTGWRNASFARPSLPQRQRSSGSGQSQPRSAANEALSAAHQLPVVVTTTIPAIEHVYDATQMLSHSQPTSHVALNADGTPGSVDTAATPQFFQSTKFFAVLDVEEAKELFSATNKVTLKPREVLFTAGEPSEAGIFIVVSGQLGVFLTVAAGGPPVHANTLRYGESVGDLDVVDNAPRSVTCIALDEGCTMVQLPRPLFMAFVHSHPHALLQYLQQGLARLWRVAHFMLSDYLALTLHKPIHAPTRPGEVKCDAATQTTPEFTSYDTSADHSVHGPRPAVVPDPRAMPPDKASPSSSTSAPTVLVLPSLGPMRVPATRISMHETILEGEEPLTIRGSIQEGLDLSGEMDSAALSELRSGTGMLQSAGVSDPAASMNESLRASRARQLPSAVGLTADEERSATEWSSGNGAGSAVTAGSAIAATAPALTSAFAAAAMEKPEEIDSARQSFTQARGEGRAVANGAPGADKGAAKAKNGPRDPEDRHGAMQAPGDMVDDDEAVRAGLKAAAQKLSAIQLQQEQQQQAEERRARQRQRKQAAAQPQGPMMVGPVCKIQRSPSLRYKFEFGRRACLADGWDVVDVEELKLSERTWARITDSSQQLGHPLIYSRGSSLQEVDWACAQFYLLLDGHLMAERRVPAPATNPATAHQGNMDGYITEAAIIRPGSAISCAAFLSYTSARCRIMALEPVRLVGFGWQQLEAIAFASKPRPVSPTYPRRGVMRPFSTTASGHTLGEMSKSPQDRFRDQHGRPYTGSRGRDTREPSDKGSDEEEANVDVEEVLIPLLVAAAAAMGPLIRRFISLGLNRVWLKSGDVAYRQGDDASCLFVVMSGRLRLIHESMNQVTGRPEVRVEEEVGRGEAVGAVFTIAGGQHDTTALCIRDSELVRMSKAAFKILSEESPMALARMFNNIARRIDAASNARVRGPKGSIPRSPWAGSTVGGSTRLDLVGAGAKEKSAHSARADVVTITIVPAGVMAALTAPPKGPTAHSAAMQAQAPGVAIARAVKRLSTVLQQELAAQVAKANGTDITNTKTGTPGVTGITGRTAQDGVVCFNSTSMGLKFNGAFERLDVLFYRSKITSWLSSQEDDNRFIILEADYHPTPWSSVCVAQADVILLVAAEGALPDLGECEAGLVWGAGGPPAATSRVANSATGLAAAARAAVAAKSTPTLSSSGVPVAAVNPLPGVATAPFVPTMKQLLHGHDGGTEPSATGPASRGPNSIIRAANAAANIRPNSIIAAANAAAASTAGDTTLLPPPEPIFTGDTIMQAPQPMYTGDAVLQGTQPMYAVPTGPIPQNIPTAPPMAQLPGDPLQPPLPGPPLGVGAGPQLPRPPIPALVRRVELVLLHSSDSSLPHDTAAWLRNRPYLARHHHVRLERQPDVARLCRWMRGKAVGLVLSGGGSRGLAHLGVLFALEDQGVPVDVVGGTSQGAFMAGLYAQGLDREAIQLAVQQYANTMGSVRHLLGDLTLPMLSLFSGRKFDDLIKSLFEGGASNIEDLWLPFFCVTTNLSRGEAMAHTRGPLWRLVRASMTIVGLLPPVCLDGELLVDGGYMNNMPVDVMRGMGVDTVIVVDVESREDLGWQSLVPYDGGLSGWRLLWDRWCPIPAWRTTSTKNLPRYAQIINQLTWMTHNHNLKRVHEEYRIDLYLRPPNIGSFKLMDFHLMERIVKDAFRDALNCLQNWSLLPEISNHVRGTGGSQPPTPGASHNRGGNPFLLARAQSDMAAVGNGLGGYPPGSLPAGSYFAEPIPGAHFPAPPSTALGPSYLPQQPSAKSELPASQLLRMGTGNGTVAYSYDGGYGLETRHSQDGVPTVPTHSFSRAPEIPGRSTFSMGPGTGAHAVSPFAGNPSFTGPGTARSMQAPSPIHPTSSITCMTQLQKKQTQMEAQAAALAAVTPGSAARAHSLAMAAAAGMLNSGAGVPAGLGGAAAVDAAAFVANAGTPHTPGSLRVSSLTPGLRGPPSTGGAPGGNGGAHLLPLSASAAAAPPPSAAAIAVEALSRVSYTGGSVTGALPGGRHRGSDRASEHRGSDRASEHRGSDRASEQSNSTV